MTPVYFPFTYITESIAAALHSCFEKVVVYQPVSTDIPTSMKNMEQNGWLDIRIPLKTDEEKISTLMKDYQNWIQYHQGSDLNVLKALKNPVPFFDETSTSNLQSEIKRGTQKAVEQPDPLFIARLFLRIAQDFDIQHSELTDDLESVDEMQKMLFQNLKGGEEDDENLLPVDSNEQKAGSDDIGSLLVSERIEAWTLLMNQDSEPSCLFVTSSKAVFDHISENVEENATMIRIDGVPLAHAQTDDWIQWQTDLIDALEILSNAQLPMPLAPTIPSPPERPETDTFSLIFSIIPRNKIDFLSKTNYPSCPNAVLCFITI